MTADVTLILEGTYPYISGGVSTWVHQILNAYPDRRFALLHIGPHPKAYEKPLYEIPKNVTELHEVYCRGAQSTGRKVPRVEPPPPRKDPSRVLSAIRRMHLGTDVDDDLLADLSSGDLTIGEFLHGDATFELHRDLYERVAPEAPFMDFFWHFRAMHIPLLRLMAAECPPARVYHAVSTGYAGLIGAVASFKTGRPLVVTEHGLYAREREMELSRATWIKDLDHHRELLGTPRPSPLRRFWSHYFRMLSRIAYHQATRLVTLSDANRRKQLADGADPAKIVVVPNGVRWAERTAAVVEAAAEPPMVPEFAATEVQVRAEAEAEAKKAQAPKKLHVGFVGRVVPIKDVITLIKAIAAAKDQIELQVSIIGPEHEDPIYAKRCRQLVQTLDLEDTVTFLGSQPVAEWYPKLDVVVLTSLSEGQPLVMLEAYAAGVPVIATDVGACRELIEGSDEMDRKIGPSGIVTRVANPTETAAALCVMARNPELRKRMGRNAKARVDARYQLQHVVAQYDALYASMES
jgi:glycosyltransferase involved in cell wall biosynthesis